MVTLDELKEGDSVALAIHEIDYPNGHRVVKVEKVTPHYIHANGRIFRRSDGAPTGRHHLSRDHIKILTPHLRTEIRKQATQVALRALAGTVLRHLSAITFSTDAFPDSAESSALRTIDALLEFAETCAVEIPEGVKRRVDAIESGLA